MTRWRELREPSNSRATEIGSLLPIGSATPPKVLASITGIETFFGAPPSNPAAITVIRTSSPRASSMVVPKIILASRCAADCTNSQASLISKSPKSDPPATERRTPIAPSIDASNSGLEMASSAARTARFSPRAEPIPMSAEPASVMMLFTSAKSKLIKPGCVIISVIP